MREQIVDVLRGLAIVGMVLSGTISRNADLPAWLFHAQIPPPNFKFNPQLAGITWVDLVFPFFIFAMGVAIPFSLGNLLAKGVKRGVIFKKLLNRSLRLFVFALMLGQLSPWHYPGVEGYYPWLAAMITFCAFFLAFGKWPMNVGGPKLLEASGYLLFILLLSIRYLAFDLPFSFNKNDIIILVLANLALFGGMLWWLTRNNTPMRLAFVALVFALRLTHGVDGSVNQALWQFSPAKTLALWFPALTQLLQPFGDLNKTVFYNPEFLKYLLILIPGTIVGDMLQTRKSKTNVGNAAAWAFALLVMFNVWALFARQTVALWVLNLLFGLALSIRGKVFRDLKYNDALIAFWSYAWLILGTVFEAWEGGIKKDPSTYSYLLITAGLSGFTLLVIRQVEHKRLWSAPLSVIEKTGVNPLIGYVVVSYAIAPILYFFQILPWIDRWHQHQPWLGVLRGLVLTSLMLVVVQWFTNKKIFWKT